MFEPKGPIKIDDTNLTDCRRYLLRLAQDRRAAEIANCCDYMSAFDSEQRRTIALLVVQERAFWLNLDDYAYAHQLAQSWPELKPMRHSRWVYSRLMHALEKKFVKESPEPTQALLRAFAERAANKPIAMTFFFDDDGRASPKKPLKIEDDLHVVAVTVSAIQSASSSSRWNAICGMLAAVDNDNLPRYVIFPYWKRLGKMTKKLLKTSITKLGRQIPHERRIKGILLRWEMLFYGIEWHSRRALERAWSDAQARMFLDQDLNNQLEELVLTTML